MTRGQRTIIGWRAIIMCVVVGAAVNVAVCWSAALWGPGEANVDLAWNPQETWLRPVPEDWPPHPTGIYRGDLPLLTLIGVHHVPDDPRTTPIYNQMLFRYGVGWRSMESEVQVLGAGRGTPAGALVAPRWLHDRPGPAYLPTRILGAGFIASSALYAAPVLIVIAGAQAARRRARRRRGCYPACNYDLRGGTGMCPECGAT